MRPGEESVISDTNATLGSAIKARRIALGWTQQELAERASVMGEMVRQSDISRLEKGRILLPRRERLESIAAALDLTLGELLSRSGWANAERFFRTQPPASDLARAPQPVEEILPVQEQSFVLAERLDAYNHERKPVATVNGGSAIRPPGSSRPLTFGSDAAPAQSGNGPPDWTVAWLLREVSAGVDVRL